MNDLAAGDIDGDGMPEFVVGYNGGGGVRLLDSEGKLLWHEADGNDRGGKVLRRTSFGLGLLGGYVSDFSLVRWPPSRIGLLNSDDGSTTVLDFDHKARATLVTANSSSLDEAYGAVARFGSEDYLVLAIVQGQWERSQLFVFDMKGVMGYREVVSGECGAVAAPETDAFLFGCGTRVLRYAVRP
jgi:hypothetical protein